MVDLQRKLDFFNNTIDQETESEQMRRQMLFNTGHCKFIETFIINNTIIIYFTNFILHLNKLYIN